INRHDSLPFLCLSTHPPISKIYTLSLHDALPIYRGGGRRTARHAAGAPLPLRRRGPRLLPCAHGRAATALPRLQEGTVPQRRPRSEEHTSELQSRFDLVCRLLLEKKKKLSLVQTI